MELWTRIEQLVARQHGVVALWQVTAMGMSEQTFYDHLRRHGWTRIDRGISAAPWSEDTFARRCTVERIRGPRGRVITGGSAFVLLGVRRKEPAEVDVWVGPGLAVALRQGVRYHRGAWLTGDRLQRIEGIPCTPVLRALRDTARSSSVERLGKDIAGLDRLRLATPAQVVAYLDRCGRFPGKPKLREAALDSVEGLVHSTDEGVARRLLAAQPFRLHPRPLLVERGRQRVGEIDLPVCAVRYGAEVDGPSHLEDGEAEKDRARDRKLERLDWLIERYPTDLIRDDPAEFVRAVRAGVERASARKVEPWPCDRCPR